MKEFIIDKSLEGTRLDKFMAKAMPSVGKGGVYKALRKKKVRVNGKHTVGTYILAVSDKVCIYMNDDCFAEFNDKTKKHTSARISIVYEDENILIANKPSGLPSQDCKNSSDSLESEIRSYMINKGEFNPQNAALFSPSLCHRLDRNTSGLVIAAKNSEALRIINNKIKNREIKKFYICKTEGLPNPPSGKISGWVYRDERARKMAFCKEKPQRNSSYCETLYNTVNIKGHNYVEAELLTGRTHQIRVSMAYIGCPICGDVKYGAEYNGKKNFQNLTAYKLFFDFTTPSGKLDYLNNREFHIQPTFN